MKFEILTSSYFDAEAKRLAKRYRSFVADLLAFQKSILENPYQGVELTTGIRKIRMPIASKGRGRNSDSLTSMLLMKKTMLLYGWQLKKLYMCK